MTIAREEIFGPVVSIIGAKDEAEAINATPYGLAGYVTAGSVERAREVARKLRAGNINLNGVQKELSAPFGGYRQSGNGREWGRVRPRRVSRGEGHRRVRGRLILALRSSTVGREGAGPRLGGPSPKSSAPNLLSSDLANKMLAANRA
jgi:hypothetical protein